MDDLKDDIEKYLKGQLGPEEMHDLEKKALSDPFLFDALGGAESIGATDFLAAVRELDQRIAGKQERISSTLVWRIAASVALLAGVSYILYTYVGSKDPMTLAQESLQEEAATSPTAAAPLANGMTTDSSLSTQVKPKEKLLSLNRTETSRPERDVRKETAPAEERSTPGIVAAEPTESQATAGASVERDDSDRSKANQIEAPDSKEKSAAADLGPSELQKKDLASGAGTPTTTAPTQPADVSPLSEIVVAGYTKGEGGSPQGTPIQLAEPAGGKGAFDNYLEKNLQYPQAALDQKIEGRVTVEFTVQSDGTLSNFAVVRGLEGGCNEEVMRLVKAGPTWKPSSQGEVPMSSTVRVSVKFNLPK